MCVSVHILSRVNRCMYLAYAVGESLHILRFVEKERVKKGPQRGGPHEAPLGLNSYLAHTAASKAHHDATSTSPRAGGPVAYRPGADTQAATHNAVSYKLFRLSLSSALPRRQPTDRRNGREASRIDFYLHVVTLLGLAPHRQGAADAAQVPWVQHEGVRVPREGLCGALRGATG